MLCLRVVQFRNKNNGKGLSLIVPCVLIDKGYLVLVSSKRGKLLPVYYQRIQSQVGLFVPDYSHIQLGKMKYTFSATINTWQSEV